MKYYLFIIAFVFVVNRNIAQNLNGVLKNDIVKLYLNLPEYCPTPDNFAIAPDGSLTLSCPNYADKTKPGIIVRIGADKEVSEIVQYQPVNKKVRSVPKGIAYDNEGFLYVCDGIGGYQGRLLRIAFINDKVDTIEVIAEGLNAPNGLRYYNGNLYVTCPMLPHLKSDKNVSDVYRFAKSERNLKVTKEINEPNLLFTIETQNPKRQFGLDGIEFDHKGNMLVGDFGDAIIYKVKLKKQGEMKKQSIYAQFADSAGIDGLFMDKTGVLWVAGFSQNQLLKVDKNGGTYVVCQFPDNNGADGALDQPVDIIDYNGKLLISNFDLMVAEGMVNKSHGLPYTISYVELKDLK